MTYIESEFVSQTNIEQGISEFLNWDKTVKAGPLKANPQKAV